MSTTNPGLQQLPPFLQPLPSPSRRNSQACATPSSNNQHARPAMPAALRRGLKALTHSSSVPPAQGDERKCPRLACSPCFRSVVAHPITWPRRFGEASHFPTHEDPNVHNALCGGSEGPTRRQDDPGSRSAPVNRTPRRLLGCRCDSVTRCLALLADVPPPPPPPVGALGCSSRVGRTKGCSSFLLLACANNHQRNGLPISKCIDCHLRLGWACPLSVVLRSSCVLTSPAG